MKRSSAGSLELACLTLALVSLALFANGCSHRATDAGAASTSFSSGAVGEPKAQLFSVPAEQMAHVQVVPVGTTRLPRLLRLTGSVAYNSFETTPVITQVSGPVARILISPGQIVQAGQPMLYVSSPDYAQTRTNFLKAREAYELAVKSYARADDLYAHHAIALADFEQAESTRNQAQADLLAAEQALKVLGVQPERALAETASPDIPVLAPIAGEVVERLAGPGQVIQAGATQVFTISNMTTVWVLANVYEHDLGFVHVGDPVDIQTDAYETTFHGRISYIAPALDATSRTLQVRIETNNPGGKLKKDMYVTATVRAGVIEGALTVPDSAVLRNAQNQPFVYVAQGPSDFGERLVAVGDSQGGKTQIVSGLQAGERVVADGSLFLQFANSLQR
jgi:cobalt-zinc-cadmium efflux system membrane fusion protein